MGISNSNEESFSADLQDWLSAFNIEQPSLGRFNAGFFENLYLKFRNENENEKIQGLKEFNKKLSNELETTTFFIEALLENDDALVFWAQCLVSVPMDGKIGSKDLCGFKLLQQAKNKENREPFGDALAGTLAAELILNPGKEAAKKIKNTAAYAIVDTHSVYQWMYKILKFFGLDLKTNTVKRINQTKEFVLDELKKPHVSEAEAKITAKITSIFERRIEKLTDEKKKYMFESAKKEIDSKIESLEDLNAKSTLTSEDLSSIKNRHLVSKFFLIKPWTKKYIEAKELLSHTKERPKDSQELHEKASQKTSKKNTNSYI